MLKQAFSCGKLNEILNYSAQTLVPCMLGVKMKWDNWATKVGSRARYKLQYHLSLGLAKLIS